MCAYSILIPRASILSLAPGLEELCSEVLADLGKRLAPSPAWYVGLLIKILSIRANTTATEPSKLLNTLVGAPPPYLVMLSPPCSASCNAEGNVTDLKKCLVCERGLELMCFLNRYLSIHSAD